MISKKIQTEVANATVKLLKKGGQGVLVKGNFIVTAAHCVEFKCDGSMVMGDWFIEQIKTIYGKLKVAPYAVEPVNDIAILGPLDGQEFYDEVLQFEEFCEKVRPIPLFLGEMKCRQKFRVYIYTHEKTWIKAEATSWSPQKDSPMIGIKAEMNIKGGTSGSPVVNEQGQLVAIVSNAGGPIGTSREGRAPRPHLALPVWISRCIRKGRFEFEQPTPKKIKIIRESMKSERR
jgi:hypothetical protein